jgi:glycosyltransferase involved in cell wall biosynthesis
MSRPPGRPGPAAPPLVSILMPVFNGERFLLPAVESLLAQTFRALEILIVDDGSTDRSRAIAGTLAVRDDRVRVFAHERNRGAPAARNTARRRVSASSEFLMSHDCDDLSLPGKIEALVDYLGRHPGIAAAGCFCDYIDDAGDRTGWPPLEWQPRWIRATFARRNSMVNSATLVRRDVADTIGAFAEELDTCDDYDFWMRALVRGHALANLPRVLHLIRLHAVSLGATRGSVMSRQAGTVAARYRSEIDGGRAARVLEEGLCRTLRWRAAARRLVAGRRTAVP